MSDIFTLYTLIVFLTILFCIFKKTVKKIDEFRFNRVKLNELETQLKFKDRQIATLKKENNELIEKLNRYEGIKEKLDSYEEIKKVSNKRFKEIRELNRIIRNLKQIIETDTKLGMEIEELEMQENKKLKEKIIEGEYEIEMTKIFLDNRIKEIKRLSDSLENYVNITNELNNDIDNYNKENLELKEVIDEYDKRIIELEKNIDEQDKQILDLREDNTYIRTKLKRYINELNDYYDNDLNCNRTNSDDYNRGFKNGYNCCYTKFKKELE